VQEYFKEYAWEGKKEWKAVRTKQKAAFFSLYLKVEAA
jgi:hypothetical protein